MTTRADGLLPPSPGQTVGPFFHDALPYDGGPLLVPAAHPGAVRLHGRVLDGDGDPVPDALVEIWQAGPDGQVARSPGSLHRDGWTFTGWGRAATDAVGHYWFSTVLPGPTQDGAAPFFAVVVLARGLLDRLFTRAYLPDVDVDADPLLRSVEASRRRTLLTARDEQGLVFDIRLQGADETVFLSYPGHRGR